MRAMTWTVARAVPLFLDHVALRRIHSGGSNPTHRKRSRGMPFSVKDLPFAKDALEGISGKTIETHHDKLYPGYVNKRNEIEQALPNADRSKAAQTYSEYRSLKLEETFNADGQILHELYFSHLGGRGGQPSGALAQALQKDFGGVEQFVEELTA